MARATKHCSDSFDLRSPLKVVAHDYFVSHYDDDYLLLLQYSDGLFKKGFFIDHKVLMLCPLYGGCLMMVLQCLLLSCLRSQLLE